MREHSDYHSPLPLPHICLSIHFQLSSHLFYFSFTSHPVTLVFTSASPCLPIHQNQYANRCTTLSPSLSVCCSSSFNSSSPPSTPPHNSSCSSFVLSSCHSPHLPVSTYQLIPCLQASFQCAIDGDFMNLLFMFSNIRSC